VIADVEVGSWLGVEGPGATPLQRALALSPRVGECFADMYRQVWCPPVADPVLLELARLRMAQLLRSDADLRLRFKPAVDSGLPETKVAELSRWSTSPLFTEPERAVVAFAELFTIDAHAVGEDECAAVTAVLPRPAVAGLTVALAIFEASTRLRLALGAGLAAPTVGVVVIDPSVDPVP
jgi:alkylhydroperoxidase family enzyme